MTNRIIWSICHFLIDIARRWVVPSPDVAELIHYATCRRCIRLLGRQGCCVFLKYDGDRILEVTFTSKEQHNRILNSYAGEDDEGDEEQDEDDPEPRRLTVGEARPERPKADFYV